MQIKVRHNRTGRQIYVYGGRHCFRQIDVVKGQQNKGTHTLTLIHTQGDRRTLETHTVFVSIVNTFTKVDPFFWNLKTKAAHLSLSLGII